MQSPTSSKPLRLGTRGSPLALAQAKEVKRKLIDHWNWADDVIEIHVMKTTGDRFTDRPLSAIGGKGLFTKELEIGLFSDQIDLAVHSMKDVATVLPEGLQISTILPRADVRDAFVSQKYQDITSLPRGAVVGTSSLRRRAQLLHLRPDLEVIEFRGVVGTRLQKLADGVADASFLAMAGLHRLGRHDLLGQQAHPIDISIMLPAAAQGAIGIEIRENDQEMSEILRPLDCAQTAKAIAAERAFLRVLDGSCRTPIAANFANGQLRGQVLSLDGSRVLQGCWAGDDPVALGEHGARELLDQGAGDVLG